MIGQLQTAEAAAELRTAYRAVKNKGGARVFQRLMTRMLGVSDTPTLDIEFPFVFDLPQEQTRYQFEKVTDGLKKQVGWINEHYTSSVQVKDVKRSLKDRTLTMTYVLTRPLVSNADKAQLVSELSEIADAFDYHHKGD